MALPWIKIAAFKRDIPVVSEFNSDFIYRLDEVLLTPRTGEETRFFILSIWGVLIVAGMLLALVLFLYKISQIYQLKKKGKIYRLSSYTMVIIKGSNIAFSFFKTIFLGDKVEDKDYKNIIDHELVHIKQKHSLDLLFFELCRIVMWFNPLVYIYQNRITEVHEFIADAKVDKANKKEQYQFLLAQVFQTQNISFINQFFKSSLIKKRIVMLQKSKSKQIFKFKYLALIPLLIGMLFYTSCESDIKDEIIIEKEKSFKEKIIELENEINEKEVLLEDEKKAIFNLMGKVAEKSVSFKSVEDAPVFLGCDDVINKRDCFRKQIVAHIQKHFKYPFEARMKGIQGRVLVRFNIDTKGNIVNIKKRGPHELLEEEALRIVSLLPKMKPGKDKNGEPVEVSFFVPITFKLPK